jgi:hypothetical protein
VPDRSAASSAMPPALSLDITSRSSTARGFQPGNSRCRCIAARTTWWCRASPTAARFPIPTRAAPTCPARFLRAERFQVSLEIVTGEAEAGNKAAHPSLFVGSRAVAEIHVALTPGPLVRRRSHHNSCVSARLSPPLFSALPPWPQLPV